MPATQVMIRLYPPEMNYVIEQSKESGLAYAAVIRELIVHARKQGLKVRADVARVEGE